MGLAMNTSWTRKQASLKIRQLLVDGSGSVQSDQNAVDAANKWMPGGAYRLAFTAITGGLTGDMGGSVGQTFASIAVSYLQGVGAAKVKDLLAGLPPGVETEALRTALQGILGCAAGAVNGNCASGALGASASVVVGDLADLAMEQNTANLDPATKQQVMDLLNSLIAGVTTAVGGDAAVASMTAKMEMENNQGAPIVPEADSREDLERDQAETTQRPVFGAKTPEEEVQEQAEQEAVRQEKVAQALGLPASQLSPDIANVLVRVSLPRGAQIDETSSADSVNTAILEENPTNSAPILPGSNVVIFTTTQPTQFVRVYLPLSGSEQVGSWVMNARDIEGLTPEQIASKFSLPAVPTMVSTVTVPAGTTMQASIANNILLGTNGGGGGVQFQIQMPSGQTIPNTWFTNPQVLK